MKKIFKKKIIITFIISSILFFRIGISGANIYNSNQFVYNNESINESLNNLNNIVKEIENIKSIGDATSSQILSGKTAVVNGNTITGSMQNNGNLNWTPSTSTKYTVPEGYYRGGTLDSSLAYQSGYDDGYSAGSQAGLDDLLNSVFTFKLPIIGEYKKDSWTSYNTKRATYTFTYNKGTITKPSTSSSTITSGSMSFSISCTNAVIKFVSSKEISVTFTIKGYFLTTEWDSTRTTTYTVNYKWTDDKTKGTVSVTGSNLSWTSGSNSMKVSRNGTPTVTVT